MDEPAWLDETEMLLWRTFVRVSGGMIQELDAALKADADVSFDDYEVLVHLSEADDQRLRMSDISSRLLHSQSRVTQRVDRLTARGLVMRERCTEDRRVTYAVLTDEGRSLIDAAAPDHVKQVRFHLVDLLDAQEIDVMQRVYDRLANRLPSGEESG